jgi:hypothetical protein
LALKNMSLIIKKNTTFKIPRTGSTAPAGIDVPNTSAFVAEFTKASYNNGYWQKTSPTSWSQQNAPYQDMMYDTSWYIQNYIPKTPVIIRNSTATNSLFIPTTGWVDGDLGSAIFYTGSSPTIPYSTNAFIITSGFFEAVRNILFTKINPNTWEIAGGAYYIYGSDLGTFEFYGFDGKNYYILTRAKALSSGIPTFGWQNFGNVTIVPQ